MNNEMKQYFVMMLIICAQFSFAQNSMHDVCPLKVGSEIPSTTLAKNDGYLIQLDSLVSKAPTVLIFYRGAWCGYCTKHLAELNEIKKDVETLGYQIIKLNTN